MPPSTTTKRRSTTFRGRPESPTKSPKIVVQYFWKRTTSSTARTYRLVRPAEPQNSRSERSKIRWSSYTVALRQTRTIPSSIWPTVRLVILSSLFSRADTLRMRTGPLHFDVHQRTAADLLHGVPLGPIKYLVKATKARLSRASKDKLQLRLEAASTVGLGCGSTLNVAYMLRHLDSLNGVEIRLLAQTMSCALARGRSRRGPAFRRLESRGRSLSALLLRRDRGGREGRILCESEPPRYPYTPSDFEARLTLCPP